MDLHCFWDLDLSFNSSGQCNGQRTSAARQEAKSRNAVYFLRILSMRNAGLHYVRAVDALSLYRGLRNSRGRSHRLLYHDTTNSTGYVKLDSHWNSERARQD